LELCQRCASVSVTKLRIEAEIINAADVNARWTPDEKTRSMKAAVRVKLR
jgi:hypothetical protein